MSAQMHNPLVIIGAGGHAQVVIDAVQEQGKYDILGLVDQRLTPQGTLMNYEIKSSLSEFPQCSVFVAIGDNKARMRLFEEALVQGWKPATIVHPSSVISKYAAIGAGTIICAGAIVGVNAQLGANSIVNTAATVDHGCQVGSHAHLGVGAHLAGNCIVKDGVFLGAGAVLIPGMEVGAWTTIGAGAVVIRSIGDGLTAVGVPAEPIEIQNRCQVSS